MRLTSLALLLSVTNLLVGCGDSGNTNVYQDADAAAIEAYEQEQEQLLNATLESQQQE